MHNSTLKVLEKISSNKIGHRRFYIKHKIVTLVSKLCVCVLRLYIKTHYMLPYIHNILIIYRFIV